MERFLLHDGYVDLEQGVVHRGTHQTRLSPIEHRLMQYLAARPGKLVDRTRLLVEVWGYRAGVRSRTIDSTVHRLREKIEADPSNPTYLLSSYGRGLTLRGVPSEDAHRSMLETLAPTDRRALEALALFEGPFTQADVAGVAGPGLLVCRRGDV